MTLPSRRLAGSGPLGWCATRRYRPRRCCRSPVGLATLRRWGLLRCPNVAAVVLRWETSDRRDEFGERLADPHRPWGVEPKFVVATTDVLDESMAGHDHLCGPFRAQPAHWSQPPFELGMI